MVGMWFGGGGGTPSIMAEMETEMGKKSIIENRFYWGNHGKAHGNVIPGGTKDYESKNIDENRFLLCHMGSWRTHS